MLSTRQKNVFTPSRWSSKKKLSCSKLFIPGLFKRPLEVNWYKHLSYVLSAVKHLSRAALEVDSFEQRLQDVNKFSHERFHCWCCQEEDKDRKKLMQDASEIYFCRINNLPSCLSSREKTRAFLRRKTASQAIAKQFFKRNHNIRFRQVKNIRLLLIQFEAEASPESLALYQVSRKIFAEKIENILFSFAVVPFVSAQKSICMSQLSR